MEGVENVSLQPPGVAQASVQLSEAIAAACAPKLSPLAAPALVRGFLDSQTSDDELLPQVPPPLPDAFVASIHPSITPQQQSCRNDQARSSGESNDTDRPLSAGGPQPTKDTGESNTTTHDRSQLNGTTPAPQPQPFEKKPSTERPKLQRPEGQIPCPRCQSSDTKFCYFNNYNQNQPRYYCKACQRYWTAGGTLRNVPPGSGKRKNKSTRKAAGAPQQPNMAQPQFLGPPYAAGLMLGDQLYNAGIKPTNAAALAAAAPFMPTPGVPLGGVVPALPSMQSVFAQAPTVLKPADGSGPLPALPPGFASATLPPLPAAVPIPLHSTASLPILPPAQSVNGLLSHASQDQERTTLTGDDGSAGGRRVRLRTDPALASGPPSGELTSDTGLSTRDSAPEWLTSYHQQAALIYGAQNAAYGFGWPYGLYNPAAQSWAVQQYAARCVLLLKFRFFS